MAELLACDVNMHQRNFSWCRALAIPVDVFVGLAEEMDEVFGAHVLVHFVQRIALAVVFVVV